MTGRSLSYRDLLADADVTALIVAAALSRFAGRMFSLAIVLYALGRFASPELAGWLSFAAMAPGLAISPLAGVMLDRFGSTWGIALDLATSSALVAAIAAADLFGGATPGVLLVLVALFSLTSPLSAAGVRTLLPRLVPEEARDRANAVDTAMFTLADLGGPALAGGLFGLLGAVPAFAVIAVMFAASATCTIRVRDVAVEQHSGGSVVKQALGSVGAVLRQPTLRALVICYGLFQVAWGILTIVLPVCVARAVPAAAADSLTGAIWAGVGLAGGCGALLAGALGTAARERAVLAGGMAVTAVAAWPLAPAFGLPSMVVAMAIAGFVAGPVDVGLLTLRQRRIDPVQLGRVLSVSISLNVAGLPLGAALGGILVTGSLPAAFVAAAIAAALGAVAVGMVPGDERCLT
jgi:predicted MFS family arabinose efflux permease